jgi:serine/threonine protein kinase
MASDSNLEGTADAGGTARAKLDKTVPPGTSDGSMALGATPSPALKGAATLHFPREARSVSDSSDGMGDQPTLAHDGSLAIVAEIPIPAVPGYEILAEIGRGGMGVVYKARHLSLERIVALKFTRPGLAVRPEDLARFRLEAASAAQLMHANIVQVFEVGTFEGQPYFAQEFVAGGSLEKRLSGRPQSPTASARLVESLAHAIHAAHGVNIVHRDLKPANVLLVPTVEGVPGADGESLGVPKITDFGLAKRLDVDVRLSQSGMILGTPSYMAPEQAWGETAMRPIGPAVDIYALGAILYEMLTGRPPFLGANLQDTLDQLWNQEPVPPRRLAPRVPRDLETICLKCLEKEPARRYATAAALAEDLERFLDGRPVVARPVSTWERVIKWARRRPGVAALSFGLAASVLALVVGGWITSASLKRALDHAESERVRADENEKKAIEIVERYLRRVGDREIVRTPESEALQEKLLLDAQEFFEGLLSGKDDPDPVVRRKAAEAYLQVGVIQQYLGRAARAEEYMQEARRLLIQLVQEAPDETIYESELAAVESALGLMFHDLARYTEAEELQSGSVARWRGLKRKHPEESGFDSELANSLGLQANLFETVGRYPEAERARLEALGLENARLAREPSDHGVQHSLARAEHNLAELLIQMNRSVEAIGHAERARELMEALVAADPVELSYRGDLAGVLNNLAMAYADDQRVEEAERLHQRAIELRQTLSDEHPLVIGYKEGLAESEHNLACIYLTNGRAGEAIPHFETAASVREGILAKQPTATLVMTALAENNSNLALAYQSVGEVEKAAATYERAIRVLDELHGEHPEVPQYATSLASSLINRGLLDKTTGKPQESLAWYDRAVQIADAEYERSPTHRDAIDARFNAHGGRAQARMDLAQFAAAADDWQVVVELAPEGEVAPYRFVRALALARGGLHAEAVEIAADLYHTGAIGGGDWYNLACLYALSVRGAEADASLSEEARQAASDAYTDRAIQLIREAHKGMTDNDLALFQQALASDTDLDPIRDRPAFQELLRELSGM